jgi:hypothetical protein
MDVPYGALPKNIERLCLATSTARGFHGTSLYNKRSTWLLHGVHVAMLSHSMEDVGDKKDPTMNDEIV